MPVPNFNQMSKDHQKSLFVVLKYYDLNYKKKKKKGKSRRVAVFSAPVVWMSPNTLWVYCVTAFFGGEHCMTSRKKTAAETTSRVLAACDKQYVVR